MSIVLAAESERMPAWMLGLWLVVSLVALALMSAFGSFQRRPDTTLQRLFNTDPVLPLFLNIMAAAGVYLAASVMFFVVVAAAQGANVTDPKEFLVGGNLVAMAIVMSMAAFLSLVIGLGLFVQDGFARVGFDRSPLQGIKYGAALILAAMPLLLLVMGASEWVYHYSGYKHEDAHELLQAMNPNNPLVRFGAIMAAVVVAPLAEELFFRGHIQPMLRRLFSKRTAMPVASPVDPALQPAYGVPYAPPVNPGYTGYPPPPPGYAPAPLATPIQTLPMDYYKPGGEYAAPTHSFWPSLLAITVTSILFAVIHPTWSWPPIFMLSVALGFAYERTGNLWVPIVMHAAFNGLMTSIYLSQLQ